MNIPAISNFNFSKTSYPAKSQPFNYGIKLTPPLGRDTVSFKSKTQTVKIMGSRANAVTFDLAKKIRSSFEQPHAQLKQLLLDEFDGVLNNDGKQGFMELLDRIKTEPSICEKTATRGWVTKKEILKNMQDVSGFCFVSDDKRAFGEFVKRILEMVKNKDIVIEEAEYHRLAPKYKNNKLQESFDSLSQDQLQKLKNGIIKIQNPSNQFWNDVDSMSGYSALHLTVVSKDGVKSEVKFMTRAMSVLHRVENVFYKTRNNKPLPLQYKYIEQFLAPLKKPVGREMTEQEKRLQTAITKYTQDAYVDVLSKPYERSITFIKPSNPILEDYDFNVICELIDTCDKIAHQHA